MVNVLLMTSDVSVAAQVASALPSNGHRIGEHTARDLTELAARLEQTHAQLAVVDIDPQPRPTLLALERVIAQYPATRFVAVCHLLDSNLLLDAMQAGVRHVLLKKSIGAELHGVLKRLGAGVAAPRERGHLVGVLPASGGCGATTLAVNLAHEVALQHGPAMLVDLDSSYGAVATYLGLSPRYGIGDVLAYDGPIDAELIRSSAAVYQEHLHVLVSPVSTDFSQPQALNYQRLEEGLQLCRRAYRFTVVDAPHVSMDTAALIGAQATRLLVVLQLTVKDLRTARSILNALAQRGVPQERLLAVVNRYSKRQMVGLEEAQRVLGDVPIVCVTSDYRSAIAAVNYGQTLAEAAPRSSLRDEVRKLAAQVTPARAGTSGVMTGPNERN